MIENLARFTSNFVYGVLFLVYCLMVIGIVVAPAIILILQFGG